MDGVKQTPVISRTMKGESLFLFAVVSLPALYFALDSSDLLGSIEVKIEKFYQCPDKEDLPNKVKNIEVRHTAKSRVQVYGDIVINEAVTSPVGLIVSISRCTDKSRFKCHHQYDYANERICDLFGRKDMPWSEFFDGMTIPQKCPIKRGNYSLNGAVLDLNKFPPVTFLKGSWRIRSSGKSKGKMWHCVVVEFDLNTSKRKRKDKHLTIEHH